MFNTQEKIPYLVLMYTSIPGLVEIGRRYELIQTQLIIGSDVGADIQLPKDLLEAEHACLIHKEGFWHLYDLTNILKFSIDDIIMTHYKFERDGEIFKLGGVCFKLFFGVGIESFYENDSYERSMIDALTKVYNRRYFVERTEEELARFSRKPIGPLSLILFDIDHFRVVNNTYGHLAGDYILKEISDRIKKRIRKDEKIFRYGGEEFAILLPQTANEEARVLAEQIRHLIEETPFVYQGESIPVTISLGVGTIQHEVTLEEFVGHIDKSLYKAKAMGRNLVSVAGNIQMLTAC